MRRVEHRRQARRWMPIWLAVAALLALAQFGLRFRTGQAESALLSLTEWTAPLRTIERQTANLQIENARVRGLLDRQASVEQPDLPLGLLQVVVEACRAPAGRLRLDSYQMEESAAAAATGGGALLAAPGRRLILAGVAESDADVSEFVDKLRESNVFGVVSLEASHSDNARVGASKAFQLRCETATSPASRGPSTPPQS